MKSMGSFSRRDFLKSGGAIVVSFTLGSSLPRAAFAQASAVRDDEPTEPPTRAAAPAALANSPTVHTWSVKPAATAGVVLSVVWTRQKL